MSALSSAIDSFISEPALAIVGASRSNRGFGNSALRVLRDNGYRVYPIHPTAAQVSDVECYRRFEELPERVNAVLVVVPNEQAMQVVRDAAAAGIRRVWLQQGAESPELVRLCDELGLETVAGECILMFAKPNGVHRFHRWIHDVFAAPEPAL